MPAVVVRLHIIHVADYFIVPASVITVNSSAEIDDDNDYRELIKP